MSEIIIDKLSDIYIYLGPFFCVDVGCFKLKLNRKDDELNVKDFEFSLYLGKLDKMSKRKLLIAFDGRKIPLSWRKSMIIKKKFDFFKIDKYGKIVKIQISLTLPTKTDNFFYFNICCDDYCNIENSIITTCLPSKTKLDFIKRKSKNKGIELITSDNEDVIFELTTDNNIIKNNKTVILKIDNIDDKIKNDKINMRIKLGLNECDELVKSDLLSKLIPAEFNIIMKNKSGKYKKLKRYGGYIKNSIEIYDLPIENGIVNIFEIENMKIYL